MSESTNIDSAREALLLAEAGKIQDAEELLALDYTGEKLDFLILRLKSVKVFRDREDLVREAIFLCQA